MRNRLNIAAICGAVFIATLPVYAAEQITLRNGFEITCHHHAPVKNKVRLYTTPANDNYIEVAPGEIASVEKVPDPPAPEPAVPAKLVEAAVLHKPYTLAPELEQAGIPVHRLNLSHRWVIPQGVIRLLRVFTVPKLPVRFRPEAPMTSP